MPQTRKSTGILLRNLRNQKETKGNLRGSQWGNLMKSTEIKGNLKGFPSKSDNFEDSEFRDFVLRGSQFPSISFILS